MNYNFKENWSDIIVPLLSLPQVKKSIKKGIQLWIKDQNCHVGEKYESVRCPASYQTSDGWCTYLDEYKETITEKLLQSGFLKTDDTEQLEDDDDYYNEEYEIYKHKILEPFIKHHCTTSLRSYQMFGACHWWNPTFCLTLAKIIYPNEKWQIRKGVDHTTIVNLNMTLVFDILYFNETDNTFGGKEAIIKSEYK